MVELPDSNLRNSPIRIIRPWRELTIFAWMVMELCWISLGYLFFSQFKPTVTFWQTLLIFGVMLFGSYLITRLAVILIVRDVIRRGILAVMILIFLAFSLILLNDPGDAGTLMELLNRPVRTFQDMFNLIPSEFLLLLFVLFVCWRGISKVGKLVGPEDVMGGFRLGVILLLIYGVVSRQSHTSTSVEMHLFLFAGLLALSSARISVISSLRGGQGIPFDRRWILGILMVILLVLWVSVFLMRAAGGQGGEIIASIVRGIVYVLALLLSPLLFLVMRIFIFLGQWVDIGRFFQILVNFANQLEALINEMIKNLEQIGNVQQWAFLEKIFGFLEFLKPFFLWAAILLFIGALLLIVRGQNWNERSEAEAEYQALADQDSIINHLRDALRKAFDKMAEGLGQVMRLRNARQLFGAMRIRRIYAHLMDLSARLDHPRPESKTPLEFLPNLEGLFPASKSELEMITAAYLRVRYGALPEDDEEIEVIESAWKRVSTRGQEMLKEVKTRK
ncbi:MAG: hypothetical protein A2W33_06560 [Chloroflexi bacterium RBG_16_52_11]|nr:MAG: hypothetical protein A2W33_06560 [Chloroflexi bacterium RBG_16_52_11]